MNDIEKLKELEDFWCRVKSILDNLIICKGRPIKNTTKKEIYKSIVELKELLKVDNNG